MLEKENSFINLFFLILSSASKSNSTFTVPHLFTLKNSSLVGDVMQATHFYAL
jgi:hypothetical protein